MLTLVVLGFWSNSQWINWQLPPACLQTVSWQWIKEGEKQVWTLDSPTTASNMANIFPPFACLLLLIQLPLPDLNPWNSRWHHGAAGLCIFKIASFEMRNFEESSALVQPRLSWNPERCTSAVRHTERCVWGIQGRYLWSKYLHHISVSKELSELDSPHKKQYMEKMECVWLHLKNDFIPFISWWRLKFIYACLDY